MQFIITNFNDILAAITSIIAGASALSALTPTHKDDTVLRKVKSCLDLFALNVGNAKTVKA
ncbi:MAG: hypothetical protein II938_04775 [Alphaproteobacteria bacterium]|nr:hypothetical protein [Alphaproteobacteria bacterium]